MINNLRKMKVILLLVLLLIIQWSVSAQTTEQIKNEVWQRELQYWKYVEKNDTTGYKTLWHKDFIGYPGDDIADKSHIADWIAELFKDKNLKYSHALYKKAVNVVDDVVLTFYDEDDILTNKNTGVVTKDTYKVTHTWKKFGNTWLIIGGMAGYKQ
jgi:hypothetical protein